MENKKFDELYSLPCEGHTEEKNIGNGVSLTYLSWAYAWATLLEQDGSAVKKVFEQTDGSVVWKDPIGGHVKVSVMAFGIERIEYLPVMDSRNQSVPFEKIDSMMANKAIQRAVTKAIGQFGIGLKLYSGENLETTGEGDPHNTTQTMTKPTYTPTINEGEPLASSAQSSMIAKLMGEAGIGDEAFFSKIGCLPNSISKAKASEAITWLLSLPRKEKPSNGKTTLAEADKKAGTQYDADGNELPF